MAPPPFLKPKPSPSLPGQQHQQSTILSLLPSLRLFLVLILAIACIATLFTSATLKSILSETTINNGKRPRPSPFRLFHSLFYSVFGIHLSPSIKHSGTSLPPSLSTYIKWHAEQRACILDATCKDELPPTLIWTCPIQKGKTCAGLGDRVRGIQITFLLSIATKRLFFIDMIEDPFPFTDVISPSLVDWRIPSTLLKKKPIENWPHLDWFFCNRMRVPRIKRLCRKRRRLPHDRALPHVNSTFKDIDMYKHDITDRLENVRWMTVSNRLPETLIPLLFENQNFVQNSKIKIYDLNTDHISSSSLLKLLMHLLFRPSPNVRAIMNATLNEDFIRNGYVSVHARTGIDVGEKGDSRFEFVNAHMLHSVRELIQCTKLSNPIIGSKRIFIATDSVKFKTLFQQMTSGKFQTSAAVLEEFAVNNETAPTDPEWQGFMEGMKGYNVEVRYINERAYHFGLISDKGRYNNKFRHVDDKKRAFANVFADLFMLGGGRSIVSSGSGFSRMAFWLGDASFLLPAAFGNGTDHCANYGGH